MPSDFGDKLITLRLMNTAEWDFIQSLSYREQLAEEDAAFVKLVYTSRLNKVSPSNAAK